jgi:hypothetical protein
MTGRLEHRLADRLGGEMRALAEQISPADLRPLRQPPDRGSRVAGQFRCSMAAMAALALVVGGLVVVRNVIEARASSTPPASSAPSAKSVVLADPGVVAVTGISATGGTDDIKLISAASGRVLKTIAQPTDGNGMALSADGKSLFVVAPHLKLDQISLTTGKSAELGSGVYPAVSPDSEQVAYATGTSFTTVAVRDLGTGSTRAISVRSLVGADSSLLNQGGLTWLGDGTHVVAIAEPDPIAADVTLSADLAVTGRVVEWATQSSATTASSGASVFGAASAFSAASASGGTPASRVAAQRTACGQQDSPLGLCLIVVDVSGRRLSAHRIYVRGLRSAGPVALLSADLRATEDFFIAQSAQPVMRVSVTGRTAVAGTVVALPKDEIPVAMAPRGDRLLYLVPGSPAELTSAKVRRGKLTHGRVLLTDSRLFAVSQVAW